MSSPDELGIKLGDVERLQLRIRSTSTFVIQGTEGLKLLLDMIEAHWAEGNTLTITDCSKVIFEPDR